MIGIGQGSRAAIASQISSLGTNFLLVIPGATTQSGARIFTGQPTLTEDHVDAVAAEFPSVVYVSPFSMTGAQVVFGDQNWGTRIQGVGADWACVRSWNAARGDSFGEAEVRSAARVCLLGSTVANALFDRDPVDEMVRIRNIPFRVVGVLETRGASLTGQDQDDTVLAPYTTVMRVLKGATKIDLFLASAVSPDAVEAAQAEIEALLRQRHRIRPGAGALSEGVREGPPAGRQRRREERLAFGAALLEAPARESVPTRVRSETTSTLSTLTQGISQRRPRAVRTPGYAYSPKASRERTTQRSTPDSEAAPP
jgi:ABC-type antimicrobial peptide transport system permease subunit